METISTGKAAPKAMSEASRALLVHFVEGLERTNFREHFNIGRFYVKQFQNYIMSSKTIPANKIADVMRAKAGARSKPLKLKIFPSFPDPNQYEIDTRKV